MNNQLQYQIDGEKNDWYLLIYSVTEWPEILKTSSKQNDKMDNITRS